MNIRLVLTIVLLAIGQYVYGETTAKQAVLTVLEETEHLSDELKTAMRTVVRQHPETTRWSGVCENSIFGIVALPLKDDPMKHRLRPSTISRANMLAVHEITLSKSLLDLYEKEGLNDATTLREAVGTVMPNRLLQGKTFFRTSFAIEEDNWIIAVRIADRDKIISVLAEPKELENVKIAYRKTMHRHARELMKNEEWEDALGFWHHLHHLKLVSATLYIDAAACFVKLDQIDEARTVLLEAMDAYEETGSASFFEKAGELFLSFQFPEDDRQAQLAFEKALSKLHEGFLLSK